MKSGGFYCLPREEVNQGVYCFWRTCLLIERAEAILDDAMILTTRGSYTTRQD